MHVTVIGGGPAGSSAALSALREGGEVSIFEKSRFPRHKVCGEFLSPEAAELLENLGAWNACEQERPSTIRRVFLSLGKQTKTWKLHEPARGLSRYRMDDILLKQAVSRGARFLREVAAPQPGSVVASGRHQKALGHKRLFGFKAHFEGPADDVMGLYFFRGAYVGVNAIERGVTNVCGVIEESVLKAGNFEIDQFLSCNQPLRERLHQSTRSMDWLLTGPLVFGLAPQNPFAYVAGDSGAFIDPFTGSGMLGAISTGILAGRAAAHKSEPALHRKSWEKVLRGQHRSANLLRSAIASGWAERLLPVLPGSLLFHSTRPRRISI